MKATLTRALAYTPELLLAAFLLTIALTGCTSVSDLPANSAESWTHRTTYGPFFSVGFTVAGASKAPDGTVKVGNYDGGLSVLGIFTNTDTFHDLVVAPWPPPSK